MSAQNNGQEKSFKKLWLAYPLVLLAMMAFDYEHGAYTDGILQITVFDNHAGLYPPLYGALAKLISLVSFGWLSLETGARLISMVATYFTVLFVVLTGVRLGGIRPSFIAGLLFLVSPLVWRWYSQVMTDPLYMALSTATLYCMVESWARLRMDSKSESSKAIAWAVALGGLATLTRYQGVLLAPLLALVALLHTRRFRAVPRAAIACGLVWLLVPAWMWYHGFVHQEQFADRASPTLTATFLAWWNTVESFVLISPYYFGYPIAAGAIVGIFYLKRLALPWYARPAAVLWGAYALMLLALQARFGSFQYRYMMPLLPMVAVLAGVGFKWLEDAFSHRNWIHRWALIFSIVYLGFFGLCIRFLQGEPYKDQFAAAEILQEQVPLTTPVYSNERYGNFTELGSVKLSFWSGRPVKSLLSPDQPMEPGSILILGNAYGGNEAVAAWMEALSAKYELQPLIAQPIRSQVIPLMDDIMVNPMFNQNPMGWVLRYVPQNFATQIFRVMPRGTAPAAGAANGS